MISFAILLIIPCVRTSVALSVPYREFAKALKESLRTLTAKLEAAGVLESGKVQIEMTRKLSTASFESKGEHHQIETI